jgi:hypothetical protein
MNATHASDFHTAFSDPVRQFLTIGESKVREPAKWPDYVKTFGIGPEHTDELIRMACDAALNACGIESSEVWAPMHAWRALGQLRAEAAVAPLLGFLDSINDDDVADMEIPEVFGMIGPVAIPPIAAYLSDRRHSEWSAGKAIRGITAIVKRHPESRDTGVAILISRLQPHKDENPTTSGFAVADLIDLNAIEAIDPIREAFGRGAVDISVAGDIEDVEIELGLRDRRATKAPNYMARFGDWGPIPGRPPVPTAGSALPKRQEVGRNDPCPCGSGKKYKKCCL